MANTRAVAELRAPRARRGLNPPVRGVALCLLGLILATAQRGDAQQPSPGLPGDETVLFQDLSRVVGASRYEQDTREAPASITIVTAEDIRRYGYRTLADVLANVRGFVVNYDRNYSYVGVRGFAVPGDYNSRILPLVNGHRLNDDVYDSGLIGTEEVVDLSLVDRVEIIRGPSSSLYGTSALFGIVNIVTRQARWVNGVKLSGEAASYGSGKGAATFGRKFGSGTELLLFPRSWDVARRPSRHRAPPRTSSLRPAPTCSWWTTTRSTKPSRSPCWSGSVSKSASRRMGSRRSTRPAEPRSTRS